MVSYSSEDKYRDIVPVFCQAVNVLLGIRIHSLFLLTMTETTGSISLKCIPLINYNFYFGQDILYLPQPTGILGGKVLLPLMTVLQVAIVYLLPDLEIQLWTWSSSIAQTSG